MLSDLFKVFSFRGMRSSKWLAAILNVQFGETICLPSKISSFVNKTCCSIEHKAEEKGKKSMSRRWINMFRLTMSTNYSPATRGVELDNLEQ